MDKVKDVVKKWLTDNYGDLETYKTIKYGNYISYMKDGKVMILYHLKNNRSFINHNEIWSFLESVFQLEYSEIQGIIKEWVEQQYNLGVLTTLNLKTSIKMLVEQQYDLEVVTTK